MPEFQYSPYTSSADHPRPASTSEAVAELRLNARRVGTVAANVVEQVEYLGNLAGCPPLSGSWQSQYPSPETAILSGYVPSPGGRLAAEQWAVTLGLDASRRSTLGTISFEGGPGWIAGQDLGCRRREET